MGIELSPQYITNDYLTSLHQIGFTKISIGIESLQDSVLEHIKRQQPKAQDIFDTMAYAKELGLNISVDMMLGLPKQNAKNFLEDISKLVKIKPTQITLYPYMIIRDTVAKPSMTDNQQFELIEAAAPIIEKSGYSRKGIWIFSTNDDVYDSSRDELITDYIGFGPAAFSTYGEWKVVNPELSVYINNYEQNKAFALVAPKTRGTNEWEEFARIIYDLYCFYKSQFPLYINGLIVLLKIAGYVRNNRLTKAGIYYAHSLTKTVVETLPYPLQNKDKIENFSEYLKDKS